MPVTSGMRLADRRWTAAAAGLQVGIALSAGGRDNAAPVVFDVLTVSGRASDEVTKRHPDPDRFPASDLDRTLRPGEAGGSR